MRGVKDYIENACKCGNLFTAPRWKINKGEAKYCSSECAKKYRVAVRPTGLVYVKHKDNPTSFKKGNKPWNEGTLKLTVKESAGYWAIHSWIERVAGKPRKCEFCGTVNAKVYQWSNKSGKYKADISDWQRLCIKCHCRYDFETFGARKEFYI